MMLRPAADERGSTAPVHHPACRPPRRGTLRSFFPTFAPPLRRRGFFLLSRRDVFEDRAATPDLKAAPADGPDEAARRPQDRGLC
jgi:hypothetical protein